MFEPAIEGYGGRYLVSPFGYVISLFSGKRKAMKSRLRNGYPSVCLRENGKRKDVSIHSLIAEYFIGKRPEGMQVNHIDGDKTNNIKFNLEYVTQSENMKHAHRIGLQCNKGENHSQSKLTEEDVVKIRQMRKAGNTLVSIAKLFNINSATASKICSLKAWAHVQEGVRSPGA